MDWEISSESSATSSMKSSHSLYTMLCSIAKERSNSNQTNDDNQPQPDDINTYWTNLFAINFIEGKASGPEDSRDDMLFYVLHPTAVDRLNHQNMVRRLPRGHPVPPLQNKLNWFRKNSPNQPSLGVPSVDWEQTCYLNLILQQFEYTMTYAICSRTSQRELQILRKVSHKVYASPSRHRMDVKGDGEKIIYPNIAFTVENFDQLFADMVVRDSEMVCVELVASDRHGAVQGTLFIGSIRYDVLKQVYDSRMSMTSRMARQISMGMLPDSRRVEFVHMRGPAGKGHAEMAVSLAAVNSSLNGGSSSKINSASTPASPIYSPTSSRMDRFAGYSQQDLSSVDCLGLSSNGTLDKKCGRNMSASYSSHLKEPLSDDETPTVVGSGVRSFFSRFGSTSDSTSNLAELPPSRRTSTGVGIRPPFTPTGMRKSQSEAENVEHMYYEVDAVDLNNELNDPCNAASVSGDSSFYLFGQAWHWFKERRRASSVGLTAYLTCVMLPWNRIIADVIEIRQQPMLTF